MCPPQVLGSLFSPANASVTSNFAKIVANKKVPELLSCSLSLSLSTQKKIYSETMGQCEAKNASEFDNVTSTENTVSGNAFLFVVLAYNFSQPMVYLVKLNFAILYSIF